MGYKGKRQISVSISKVVVANLGNVILDTVLVITTPRAQEIDNYIL